MADEVERVAKSLTKAQRALVLRPESNPGLVAIPKHGRSWAAYEKLALAGLVERYSRGFAKLNETGLAVRTYLKDQTNGQG